MSGAAAPARGPALIVTADDFGIGRATSEGIVRAHLYGPVTAASLMTVTGDHVRASIPLLEHAPRLEIGLHLVLTDAGEKPLAARSKSGLVDRAGRFLSNGRLWMTAWAGRLQRTAVLEEIAAQAEMFVRLMGRLPAYVDCHHHAHQLPTIRDALGDAIEAGLLPPLTRATVEPPAVRGGVASAPVRRMAAHGLGRAARAEFRRRGLWTNEFFFGMLDPGDLAAPFPWAAYLRRLPSSGTVEWVVHPGLPDDTLVGRDPYIAERVRETEVLTDPRHRETWAVAPLTTKSAAAGGPGKGGGNLPIAEVAGKVSAAGL